MVTAAGSTRRAYGLVVVASLGYTLLSFVWFSLPAYLPTVVDDLGLTGTQAGVVVGAIPLTYVPLALFSGLVVDRVGPGRSLAAGVLLYGVAQIGRSAVGGFPSLLAATVLLGLGATAITFGLPKLVSVLFPPDETGLPSSIYLVGASAGSAAVFGIGRPVLGPALGGWRPLFFWSGLVAVGYGVGWLLLALRVGIDADTADEESSFSPASIRRDFELVLSNREMQLLVVVGTMYLLVNHGVQGWLPTVLEARGFSADAAGGTTSAFVVAFAAGVLAVPAVADRYAVRRPAVMACGVGVFVGGAGLVVGTSPSVLVASVLLAGAGVGGLSPLVRAIPPELPGIGARLTGTAIGFVFAVGEVGGFVGPVLVGSLHDATGSFGPGLAVLAASGLVVVLAGEALRRYPA